MWRNARGQFTVATRLGPREPFEGKINMVFRSYEDKAELQRRAKIRGVSVAELVRIYITWAMELEDEKFTLD